MDREGEEEGEEEEEKEEAEEEKEEIKEKKRKIPLPSQPFRSQPQRWREREELKALKHQRGSLLAGTVAQGRPWPPRPGPPCRVAPGSRGPEGGRRA